MKNRANNRAKPDAKTPLRATPISRPDPAPLRDGMPTPSSARLAALGKDIAGLRRALDKLAAEKARDHETP